jgi:hypothetical protein
VSKDVQLTKKNFMTTGNGASVRRRWIVCAVVLAGHVGALLVLGHHRPNRGNAPSEWSIEITFIREPEDLKQSTTRKTARNEVGALRRRPTHTVTPSTPMESAPSHIDEPRKNAITDWEAAAQDAADTILQRERQKAQRRSFLHEFPSASPEKPGIFGSQKENQRKGLVEDGTRFWVTDNCYFDVPRGTPPPRLAGEFHLLTPTCKPPPTGGGDHMLEDMMPDYLRKPTNLRPSK